MLSPSESMRRLDLIAQAAEKRKAQDVERIWAERERNQILRRELESLFKTQKFEG